jgi:Tol biopolymer transport system component
MDYSLKFSPDGQMIAFTRQIDEFYVELWAINTDGTDERTIVNTQDLSDLAYEVRDPSAISVNPYQYTWIPGTHTIAFNIQQVYQGPGLSLLDDLRLVNVDTLDLSTLLLPGYGGEFVYSPDGNQIAISKPTAISLINSDASNWREVLVYDPVITYSEYRFYAKPVWSPDSSFLYVAIPPVDPLAEPRQSTGIWNIPTDGSSASQTGSVKSAPFFVGEVEFSPDLSRIAYPRETGEPAQNLGELHISNPDGSGDKIYISGGFVGFAGWATDSWKFNFNIDEDRRMQLGVIENSPIPFTDNPYGIHNIQWIDEQHYLFLRERDGEFDLYLGNLESEFIVLDSQVDPSRQYDFFR